MKAHVEVLRAALNKPLDHAKETQGGSIDMDADVDWFVPKEFLRNPAAKPTEMGLGSLDDDWSEVAAIGSGTKEPFGDGLVWASTVLRAIGDRTP